MPDKESVNILLVDDDPADQKLTLHAFKKSNLDNNVIVLNNGEEAINYLMRIGEYSDPETYKVPNLMLLDLNMPRVDGYQVLTEMRENPDCPSVPTIVLTTSDSEHDVVKSYGLGVSSFITKPVDMKQFVDAIAIFSQYWLQVVALPQQH